MSIIDVVLVVCIKILLVNVIQIREVGIVGGHHALSWQDWLIVDLRSK